MAVITGSTQGLGAAIAKLFVSEGAKVVLTGLSARDGTALAKKLGRSASFHQTDLVRVDDCRALIEVAQKRFGGVDILVNNAVDATRTTVDDLTPEVSTASSLSTFARRCSWRRRRLARCASGRASSSTSAASTPSWASRNCSSTRRARQPVQTASRNLANYLKFDRVRVYCLNCGWMNTEGERAMMKRLGHGDDFLDRQGKAWPLGRILKPTEVAEVVLFLASSKAAAFSGQVIELEQFPTGALGAPQRGGLT